VSQRLCRKRTLTVERLRHLASLLQRSVGNLDEFRIRLNQGFFFTGRVTEGFLVSLGARRVNRPIC
jgi:hypothetical protein